MKSYLKPTTAIIICTLLFFNCKPKAPQEEKTAEVKTEQAVVDPVTPGFVHAVYFWLKKDNPELVEEFKTEALPKLAKISSIQSVYWGPPAGTPREVVDNTYDIAWIVNFENAEDQDAYQVDPLHVEFVEKYKSLFDKVQVYDNLVEQYQVN